jgi:hypothetical protein
LLFYYYDYPRLLTFEKVNKINKPLPKPIKRREKTQINKIIDEKGDNMTNTNETQSIIRKYFSNLNSIQLENLEEIDKLLAVFDLKN